MPRVSLPMAVVLTIVTVIVAVVSVRLYLTCFVTVGTHFPMNRAQMVARARELVEKTGFPIPEDAQWSVTWSSENELAAYLARTCGAAQTRAILENEPLVASWNVTIYCPNIRDELWVHYAMDGSVCWLTVPSPYSGINIFYNDMTPVPPARIAADLGMPANRFLAIFPHGTGSKHWNMNEYANPALAGALGYYTLTLGENGHPATVIFMPWSITGNLNESIARVHRERWQSLVRFALSLFLFILPAAGAIRASRRKQRLDWRFTLTLTGVVTGALALMLSVAATTPYIATRIKVAGPPWDFPPAIQFSLLAVSIITVSLLTTLGGEWLYREAFPHLPPLRTWLTRAGIAGARPLLAGGYGLGVLMFGVVAALTTVGTHLLKVAPFVMVSPQEIGAWRLALGIAAVIVPVSVSVVCGSWAPLCVLGRGQGRPDKGLIIGGGICCAVVGLLPLNGYSLLQACVFGALGAFTSWVFARYGPTAVAGMVIAFTALLGVTVVVALDGSLHGGIDRAIILLVALIPLFLSLYWGSRRVPASGVPATNAELDALWNPPMPAEPDAHYAQLGNSDD